MVSELVFVVYLNLLCFKELLIKMWEFGKSEVRCTILLESCFDDLVVWFGASSYVNGG